MLFCHQSHTSRECNLHVGIFHSFCHIYLCAYGHLFTQNKLMCLQSSLHTKYAYVTPFTQNAYVLMVIPSHNMLMCLWSSLHTEYAYVLMVIPSHKLCLCAYGHPFTQNVLIYLRSSLHTNYLHTTLPNKNKKK